MAGEDLYHLIWANEDCGIYSHTFSTEETLYQSLVKGSDGEDEDEDRESYAHVINEGYEWCIIHGTRVELDRERLARMQQAIDDAEDAENQRAAAAAERAAYERLKAKFEP